MSKCIYPGTFDPITKGHIDIVQKALRIFDEVIVAVAANEGKRPLFSLDLRLHFARLATAKFGAKVRVEGFSNLLVEFAQSRGANVVVRGLRAASDFEYELQIGYANEHLWSEFETIYFMPKLEHSFISSSIVRNVLTHGGDIASVVPSEIAAALGEVRERFLAQKLAELRG